MLALNRDLIDFWLMPWSAFFRATCLWFTLDTQPIQGRPPEKEPPRWMRPLFLQRWVAQAVTTRLKANPSTTAYRFGKESESCWDAVAWLRYDWRILRQFNEDILLWIFGMEADRLLRIAQEHPSMVGQVQWTCVVLGASEHLAQLYGELKRRQKALPARTLLREELRRFAEWQEGDALPRKPGD